MKRKALRIALFCGFCLSVVCHAQQPVEEDALTYRTELFGSAATGDYTPLWMSSHSYGVVPAEAGNGYLRAALSAHQSFGKGFYWRAGLDALVVAPRHRNLYIQQLYGEIGYKALLLSVGSKERYYSLFDRTLSSGDMISSTNSRPIPELNISIPSFTVVPFTKGWLQLKGEFSVGYSLDQDFLEDFRKTDQYYTDQVRWHRKSIHFQIKDTRNGKPLYFAAGVRHIAQWGGESSDPELGVQPHSLKDFVRILFGKSGGEDASLSDQINVLGNHHISYDIKLGYQRERWAVQAYYQHLSSDKSGLLLFNGADGLWGIQTDLTRFPWLSKVVLEFCTTRNQSGSFHYIDFDHDQHPGRGGGADNYYNNQEYTTGLTYFNRAIGSPLLPAPLYNKDGLLGFKNNRIRAWYVGIEGRVSTQLSYRLRLSFAEGWGTAYHPFLNKKESYSFAAEMVYQHPRLKDWDFRGSLGGDTGEMYGNKSLGMSLSVSKRGILTSLKR